MKPPKCSKTPLSIVLAFVVLHAGVLAARSSSAESNDRVGESFDTVTLGLEVTKGAGLGFFGDLWGASPGLRLGAAVPVWVLVAEAGVEVFEHDASHPSVPDFRCVWVFSRWGYRWELPRRLSFTAGLDAGVLRMTFEERTADRGCQQEIEFGFGVASRIAYRWSGEWSFFLGTEYRKVLTKHPVEYIVFGAGLSRSFVAPRWLREFLD